MKKYNIENISLKLIERITDVLDEFDLDYQEYEKRISLSCPIHGGDNPEGMSIMKSGIGNWKCFTEHCHEKYGNSSGASIIQLIQALLNKTFFEALEWSAKFVGENKENAQTEEDSVNTHFIQLCKYINRKKRSIPTFTPRELVKTFLQIPAEYYIKRGYGEEVLNKFDVGYCFNQQKPFFDRIITPFYDDDGKYMIGCSGRNKHERCPNCNMFHQPNTRCPITKQEKLRSTKWKHSTNFEADSYLYNYWNAKQHILDTYTVILVEGSGDVWRLEEAGIYNSLALLGDSLSKNQQIILEESGAINILLATDNDKAGQSAAHSIMNSCSNLFNIHKIDYPTKDPGSLSIEQIKKIFIPILERI